MMTSDKAVIDQTSQTWQAVTTHIDKELQNITEAVIAAKNEKESDILRGSYTALKTLRETLMHESKLYETPPNDSDSY